MATKAVAGGEPKGDSVTVALVGVLGVLAGVALAAVFELLRIRSERRSAGRVAALVISSALTSALADVDFYLMDGRQPAPEREAGVTRAWMDHRAALAYLVRGHEFMKVALKIGQLAEIYRVIADEATGHPALDIAHQRDHLWESLAIVSAHVPMEPGIPAELAIRRLGSP